MWVYVLYAHCTPLVKWYNETAAQAKTEGEMMRLCDMNETFYRMIVVVTKMNVIFFIASIFQSCATKRDPLFRRKTLTTQHRMRALCQLVKKVMCFVGFFTHARTHPYNLHLSIFARIVSICLLVGARVHLADGFLFLCYFFFSCTFRIGKIHRIARLKCEMLRYSMQQPAWY